MEEPTMTKSSQEDGCGSRTDTMKTSVALSFSALPEVILVKIMEYLNLKEKYYLSVTCQRFYDLFEHPTLWKCANITLFSQIQGHRRSTWKFQTLMPNTMVEITERFSHLFQHLSLRIPHIIQRFDNISLKLLKGLSEKCRLESLSLEVGCLESKDEEIQGVRTFYSDTRDVHLLTAIIRHAFRLKCLEIVSWPFHANDDENDIFQAILSNDRLKTLETISFFFIENKQQWTGRVPTLPTPELTMKVLSFLPELTCISLRSPMLNDEMIQNLAIEKRKNLDLLRVLVMWSRPFSIYEGFKIPEIEGQSWGMLKIGSPFLRVELLLHIRIPFDELKTILMPELPLSSISILRYGQCSGILIDSIASKYGDTLVSFTSFCDSDNCDSALLNLVKECKHLNNFVYHGDINYKTIMQMASLLKDKTTEVKVFEFKEQNVKTNELCAENTEDDDIVIRRNEDSQEYFITGIHAWHVDEEIHQRKIDEMVDHVKNIFGNFWSLHREMSGAQ